MAVPVTAAPPRREASVAETLGLDGPSAAVGVLFGFFPARRRGLDPIDALRHE